MVCAEDQALLETASVVGVWFSAATVAAGMDCTVEDIETRLAALARQQQLVRRQGTTWPDGTVVVSYRFIHALYQEISISGVSQPPGAPAVGPRRPAAALVVGRAAVPEDTSKPGKQRSPMAYDTACRVIAGPVPH